MEGRASLSTPSVGFAGVGVHGIEDPNLARPAIFIEDPTI
jgi:hypothetical protein